MTDGLVSIIIPTYNRAASVVEAVASAKAQTYPHTQILVIDDGSTDDTEQQVSRIGGVTYYRQTHGGQGSARNRGLSLATGEYIASLDSDDLWDPDYLATSIGTLSRFDLDFVFTNWTKARNGQQLPSEWLSHRYRRRYQTTAEGEWWMLTPEQVRRLFLSRCPAPSSSLVARRQSIASGWGEQMLIADDWYLLLDMALQRPCRAAFTLTPRWVKRVDDKNVYDGRPAVETLGNLYLHDYRLFRRDFKPRLTRRERVGMARREMKYRMYLWARRAAAGRIDARPRVPKILRALSPIVDWLLD